MKEFLKKVLYMLPLHVEMLLGHDTGLSMSYYRPSTKTLMEDYLKAVDLLTINADRIILQKQVAELTEKSKEENYIIKGKLSEKDEEIRSMKEELSSMRAEMNDVLLEVLKIAKSKNGMIGKDRTMLDEKGRVTFGYVDNNNQIVEVKIPLDGVEIDRVATSQPPSVSIPIDGVKANNFIRQASKDVAKQAQATGTKKEP
jgi:hypothetical protein